MNVWAALEREFADQWQTGDSVGTLVGCSGGADSVALTRLLASQWRWAQSAKPAPLVIAHFNHRLRGNASDQDEQFVRSLAAKLGLPIRVGVPRDHRVRNEASLRKQRREFFVEAASQTGCRYVAVAHSKDDQAETVLHHFFRGTGPAGLAGMLRAQSLGRFGAAADLVLKRPLLTVDRATIREALVQLKQRWCEDDSNASSRYTRNWLRHEIIPTVETRFPAVADAIDRASRIQNQMQGLLNRAALEWLERFGSFVRVDTTDVPSAWRLRQPFGGSRCGDGNAGRHDWMDGDPLVITTSCQLAWDQMRWSRSPMTQDHWLRLANRIEQHLFGPLEKEMPKNTHWPGNVVVSIDGDWLVFRSLDR
ncbi:MAG: tRNA lysidine(34) synthetase TilS [Planctomycetota bacterium]